MTPVLSLSFGEVQWALSTVALVVAVLWLLGQLRVMAMAWARRRQCSRARRWWVLALNIWVTAVVLLLLAPPKVPDPHAASVTLITEGTLEVPAGRTRYRLGTFELPGADALPHVQTPGQIVLRHPTTSQLLVTGHGLSAADWANLPEPITVQWSPPELQGLTDLQWPSYLGAGEALDVTGRLRWDGSKAPLMIALVDASGRSIDTQTVLPGEQFQLQALPPVLGPVEYTLEVSEGDSVRQSEPIASFVRAPEPPRLMIWQSSPSFDTQQLSRWAADSGAQVLVRTQISRDRYLSQRINVTGDVALALVPSLLATIDVMVLDGRQWLGLSGADRAILLSAASEGLGLLVLLDATLAQAMVDDPDQTAVFGVALSPDDGSHERLAVRHGQPIAQMPLPVTPWSMNPIDAQPLTVDEDGAVLEVWRQQGLGRVAMSRLRDRYRWVTSGAETGFSQYWANLMTAVARPSATARLQSVMQPTTVRPFERLQICADNPQAQTLSAIFAPLGLSSEPVPLIAPSTGGSIACGYVWTAQVGWHELSLQNDEGSVLDQFNLRVWADSEHQTDRFARRHTATSQVARATEKGYLTDPKQSLPQSLAPINPWWLWTALLAGLVPLWLERRLLSGRQPDADVG